MAESSCRVETQSESSIMPNIDIDVDINLQKAFALPSCADISLPKPKPLKIQLPTGGSISALARHELPLVYISEGQRIPEDLLPARAHHLVARAVELARRSHAQTEEELLSMRFGGMAHALA